MPWQTSVVVQLQAGDTIINPNGSFTYSATPAAGDLIGSITPAAGTDDFGNHYLKGVAAYGTSFAASLDGGFLTLYTGSLAAGWTSQATILTDALGDLLLVAATGRPVTAGSNTLDDGAGNMTVAGTLTVGGTNQTGTATGSPKTSGPSATTSSFPAASSTHTHDFAGHTHTL